MHNPSCTTICNHWAWSNSMEEFVRVECTNDRVKYSDGTVSKLSLTTDLLEGHDLLQRLKLSTDKGRFFTSWMKNKDKWISTHECDTLNDLVLNTVMIVKKLPLRSSRNHLKDASVKESTQAYIDEVYDVMHSVVPKTPKYMLSGHLSTFVSQHKLTHTFSPPWKLLNIEPSYEEPQGYAQFINGCGLACPNDYIMNNSVHYVVRNINNEIIAGMSVLYTSIHNRFKECCASIEMIASKQKGMGGGLIRALRYMLRQKRKYAIIVTQVANTRSAEQFWMKHMTYDTSRARMIVIMQYHLDNRYPLYKDVTWMIRDV